MDFGLSEEQLLLEETIQSFLKEKVPITRVRELRDAVRPVDRDIWQGLAELGATGILVPEKQGGSELSLLDAALVSQALGHAATPTPFLGSSVIVPMTLRQLGGADAERWLGGIATGELVFGVALTERFSIREAAGLQLKGDQLGGKAMMAIDAVGADYILLAVDNSTVAVIRGDAAGLEAQRLVTLDKTRCTSELLLNDVTPEAVFKNAGPALEQGLLAGRIALAADTFGACESMIEQAVAYAQQRKQFERVIASFQAVKHLCAEMIAELETARSLVWYAAFSFDENPEEAPRMACHALAHMSEIGREIASTATQVHGGIGWTDEQNVHFWFKRVAVARHLLGGPEYLRDQAAQLEGLAAAS